MKKIDILTIFPEIIKPYLEGSIMARAAKASAVNFNVVNIRDFATNKHKRVDDTPYGGGAGMVMQIEPIYESVKKLKMKNEKLGINRKQTRIILLSAKGKRYTQRVAERLSNYDNLILICGRYEGVDERVAKYVADEEISIGDFVLTGGELGALVVADSVVRLLPGVLGNSKSIVHESHSTDGYKEYPQYTKPEIFNDWKVPEVLLSGHHKKIQQWRDKTSKNSKICSKEEKNKSK